MKTALTAIFLLSAVQAGANEHSLTGPDITCQNLMDAVYDALRKMNQHHATMARNLTDLSNAVSTWHGQLSLNEGRTVFIPFGYFWPMKTTSDKYSGELKKSSDFYQNQIQVLFGELEKVLPTCLK